MFPEALSHSGESILTILIFLPTIGALLQFIVGPRKEQLSRNLALLFSGATLVVSLILLTRFVPGQRGFQFVERFDWMSQIGVSYALGIDGLSLWLVVLTTLLTFLVTIASGSIAKHLRAYLGFMLLLETGMLGTLLALDAMLFYVFWELMLIPMYFLIGVWGGPRRVYAALKFVLYTALGSLLMLVAIVYLASAAGDQLGHWSFYFGDWTRLKLPHTTQVWLFAAFALAFAIKIPVFPLHTWLPDAHVEAPTGGSVILAGVLLKMGLYGLIRVGIPVFPQIVVESAPLFALLGVIGIVYGALVAWVQTDIKKLVAYSSVSHLGFCVLGFASLNLYGMQGSILQMINHGISTAALFFLVGVLYDRKHTRELDAYGGLAAKIPLFAFVFMIFTLSSVGLPLTNGFIGEFLILLGGFTSSKVLGAIAVSGVVLGALYMLMLYRRVIFGPFNESRNGDLTDLTLSEQVIFAPLIAFVFVIGLYPQPFLAVIEPTSIQSLEVLARVSKDHGELISPDEDGIDSFQQVEFRSMKRDTQRGSWQ